MSRAEQQWNAFLQQVEEAQEVRHDNQPDDDIPIPIVAADAVVWKYAQLQKDIQIEETEAAEDERFGVSAQGYQCEICRVGRLIRRPKTQCAEVSIIWQQIQEEEENSYREAGDDVYHDTIAQMFNSTIYRNNKDLGTAKQDLKKWNRAMVRYHFRRCDRSRPERVIDENMDFCMDLIRHIRKNELLREKYVNGDLVETEVGQKSFEKITKAMLTHAQLAKIRASLVSGPATGVGITGRKRKRDYGASSAPGAGGTGSDVRL